MIRVLLADDQALVRAGFRMLVSSSPDMEIVGEAGDGLDTYLASKLRGAGFVFIGKTNLPELANGATTDDSSTFGRTNNPWNFNCSPGGSSSGSCAAVAAGLV